MTGVGGALGCDGAILLQWLHLLRVSDMSVDIPGQNIEDSALACIAVIPWCAAWRESRIS